MSEVEYWDGTGVTASILEAHVRQLAEKRAEHVYDKNEYPDRNTGSACKYTHTLEDHSQVPGCIVGVAIHEITGKLVNQDNHNGGVLDFLFMRSEFDSDTGEWSDRAKFLANVQGHQDNGVPWGRAVERADDRLDSENYHV